MKICYLIQTHKQPNQIERLVRRIESLSPNAQILVSHDFTKSDLDRSMFKDLANVDIIASHGGRGNFSLAQGYLDAIRLLLNNGSHFDWLINLSGQDYPIQPLDRIEDCLAETSYDGFVEQFKVFSSQSPWKQQECYSRYHYRYQTIVENIPEWQIELLRPLKALNYIQPFFRVNVSYGITLGRKIKPPFNPNFVCYGGSFFCTLSRKCVEYLDRYVESNPDIIEYYRGASNPVESFIQTILINSQLFALSSDYKHYFDFSQTRNGHPKILTTHDLPTILASQAHFARKFDLTVDSDVLDVLDRAIDREHS